MLAKGGKFLEWKNKMPVWKSPLRTSYNPQGLKKKKKKTHLDVLPCYGLYKMQECLRCSNILIAMCYKCTARTLSQLQQFKTTDISIAR